MSRKRKRSLKKNTENVFVYGYVVADTTNGNLERSFLWMKPTEHSKCGENNDLNCHIITGSDGHFCLFDHFHERKMMDDGIIKTTQTNDHINTIQTTPYIHNYQPTTI